MRSRRRDTATGHALGLSTDRHERAAAVERIVRRDYLDDDADAADIALGVIEQEPFWSDEQVAAHVAALIEQA
jgi:hypothetical protein